jgi:hypothetical protein
MTISSVTNKTSGTAGTGTVGQEISFTFPVFAEGEVVGEAIENATADSTTLVQDTDYTISLTGTGTPNYTGGAITMLVATYDSDYTIYLYRVTTQTQATDLIENDNIPADTIEKRFDQLFAQIADLQEQINRCIRVPLGDGTITTLLPNKVDRASDYLKFDADGDVEASAS